MTATFHRVLSGLWDTSLVQTVRGLVVLALALGALFTLYRICLRWSDPDRKVFK